MNFCSKLIEEFLALEPTVSTLLTQKPVTELCPKLPLTCSIEICFTIIPHLLFNVTIFQNISYRAENKQQMKQYEIQFFPEHNISIP